MDGNGYFDLIVGFFGVDKVVVYRGCFIVFVSVFFIIFFVMFNLEECSCSLEGNFVVCINFSFCFNVFGKYVVDFIGFIVEF